MKRNSMTTELSSLARDLINARLVELDRNIGFACMEGRLDHASVYRYLNGSTHRISFETAARLMKVLGITMVEVFGEPRPLPSSLPKGV